jgi:excisionase family DNA binding protein
LTIDGGSGLRVTIDLEPVVDALVQRLQAAARHPSGEPTPQPKRAYRVREAAEQLSISEREAWELIGSGELESIQISRMRVIPASAIDAYLGRKLEADRQARAAGDGGPK